MAGDDDLEVGRLGHEIELFEIVKHVDRYAADLDDLEIGDLFGPLAFVVVAADGRDRGDLRKLFEYLGLPDIARVEDLLHAIQRGNGLRSKEAVRVGNDTDNVRHPQLAKYRRLGPKSGVSSALMAARHAASFPFSIFQNFAQRSK
jgi:hypothetical protein